MPSFNAEALFFCAAWAALALTAGFTGGWPLGAAFSVGLMLVIMPISTLIVARTENLGLERLVRWSLLALAFCLFLLVRNR